MNAALYCLAKVDGEALTGSQHTDLKPFFATSGAGTSTADFEAKENEGMLTFEIAKHATSIDTTTIHQLDLYIFINGWDEDCTNASLGSKCTIDFKFYNKTE